jgi:import inner membrane translocase subunit TIM50
MGKLSFGLLGLSLGLGIFYMGREWEEDELKEQKRVSANCIHFFKPA